MPRRAPSKQKLNKQSVGRLQKQARTYLVWDTVQRGFAVRVEPTGYERELARSPLLRRRGRRTLWERPDGMPPDAPR